MSAPRTAAEGGAWQLAWARLEAVEAEGALRALAFVGALLLAWVTLKPFPDLSGLELRTPSTGNEQLTYLAYLALSATCIVLVLRSFPRALAGLATAPLLALGGWTTLSVVLSQDVGTSLRRFVLTVCVVLVAACLLVLPRRVEELGRWLAAAALALLAACYLGLLLAPGLAIHQLTDALEPGLAGDWRGVFGHKNTAAAMMAMMLFVGLYLARAGRPALGGLVAGLAGVFLLFSGGKSAMALCLGTLAVTAVLPHLRGAARRLVALAPLALLNLLSVGTVLDERLAALAALLPLDVTFTGRTDIWRFALDQVMDRPLLGYGFQAFWGSGAVLSQADRGSWAGVAAHSHNGFLDLAVTMGLPGLLLALVAFVVAPLKDYGRAIAKGAPPGLALFFLRVWLFGVSLSAMESFYFDRADPIWFTFLIGLFGLRLLARFRAA